MSALLAGMDEHAEFDARDCACYVGTSAGSIVAASLVAGLDPGARLGSLPPSHPPAPAAAGEREAVLQQAFRAAAELTGTTVAPLAALLSASTSAGGAMLRRTLLRRVPSGRRSLAELGRQLELADVHWDGRLRVVAVERDSGRRVVFGAPGAPELPVSLAVQASCAIPGVFRPVVANGHTYLDGGVWSPTNMDAAEVARGDRVLCLNPTGSLRPTVAAVAGAIGPLSRGIAGAEALVLRNRGAVVRTINPDRYSAAAMGTNLMDPRRRREVIEAGLAQGRGIAARGRRQAA
jgi:NTE family protein